jgi:DAK2 domain fusion protein YloV
LERHIDDVNALNVFPVPDGDTGTNMHLTVQAALKEMERLPSDALTVAAVAHAAAHGALMGARGNSGVILSQILRGFARRIDGQETLTAQEFAAALTEAVQTAYKGVIKPVEGTILTVIRETAEAAVVAARETDDVIQVLKAATNAARTSVARTPDLLEPLRLAGVVDAGGQGLFYILEGALRYVQGESVLSREAVGRASFDQWVEPEEGYGYDIQFILKGENLDVEAIRAKIASMGESTLVVGDEHTVKVHTHAPNPGPIIEYGASLGPITNVIIENMQEQYRAFRRNGDAARAARLGEQPRPHDRDIEVVTHEPVPIATVVVATGAGLIEVFKSLGASCIVYGGQTMNPSTEQIAEAIAQTPSERVIVLPNNKNIIMAAQEAQRLSTKQVVLVPTETIPQGIAALLALNQEADLEANRLAMENARRAVRTGEVTTAVRSSHVDGVDVVKGETIGLVDGHLVAADSDVRAVVLATLRAMQVDRAELLTIYYGGDVMPEAAQEMARYIKGIWPHLEVEVLAGGQPFYHYILSTE